MPACPVCRDDFEDDVEVCPVDGVALVERGELPPVPVEDAALGVFHPGVAGPLLQVLGQRAIPVRVVEIDDDRVELRVPAPVRDRLRADLTVGWDALVRALPPEVRVEAATADTPLVGWHDAPSGSWVDREGRLQVDASDEELAVADASRTIGPGLVALGVVTGLLAWFTGGSDVVWLFAGSAVVLGALLPR